MNTIDLGTLGLGAGQGKRLELELRPDELVLGGEPYAAPAEMPVVLEVSRTATGHAMRLRFAIALTGRCMRCLEESSFPVEVDAREVHQPASGDEELTSPYVADDELDVSGWARDAIVLALPQSMLCRPDCAGLCPECGISLNGLEPGTHRHERAPDPRWAKLRELLD